MACGVNSCREVAKRAYPPEERDDGVPSPNLLAAVASQSGLHGSPVGGVARVTVPGKREGKREKRKAGNAQVWAMNAPGCGGGEGSSEFVMGRKLKGGQL